MLEFSDEVLSPGGSMVLKYLQGADEQELVAEARSRFAAVKVVKPAASRKQSREAFLVATGRR